MSRSAVSRSAVSLGPTTRSRRGPALLVLCLAEFMLVLDDTVMSVALPSVRAELGFSTASLAWVVNAYFLAFGGLLLLFGRAADLLGRRRLFLGGVLVFAAASLVCGLAQDAWMLVAGRFAQGTGAAMASPAALALVTLLFPRDGERAKALAVWGGIAGLAGTSGLVISGVLTGLASWRWIFFINLPVAALALVLIPRLVAESRSDRPAGMDVAGTVLGTGSVTALVYGLLHAADSGWAEPAAIASLVLAVVLAVAFVVVESRTRHPLVPPSFLACRTRIVAIAASLPFTAAFFSMSFLLMLYFQTVLGYRPLTAGIAYLPFGAGILTGVALSARLTLRLGVRWTLTMSLVIASAGLLCLTGAAPGDVYVPDLLPGILVAGFGAGIGFPTLTVAAMSGTTREDAGFGSAAVKAVQQLGGAVGLAVLVNLVTNHGDGRPADAQAFTEGVTRAFTATAAVLALCAVLVAVLLPRRYPGEARNAPRASPANADAWP